MSLLKFLQVIVLSVLPAIALAQNTIALNFEPSIQLTANAGEDRAINPGEAVTLGGNPVAKGNSGVVTYEWTPSNGLSDPQSASPKASPVVTTVYTLKVTDVTGCFATDEVVLRVNTASGVKEEAVDSEKEPLSVFPNPNNGKFYIRPNLSDLHGKANVRILDMIGKIVFTEFVDASGEIWQFDVLFLKKGLYCLQFTNGNFSKVVKFIIN